MWSHCDPVYVSVDIGISIVLGYCYFFKPKEIATQASKMLDTGPIFKIQTSTESWDEYLFISSKI